MPTSDEKTWAIAAHIGPLVAAFLSAGLLQFLVPLGILLLKKDSSRFVGHHARQSLNFQLTLFLVAIAFWILTLMVFVGGLVLPPILIASAFFWCLGPVVYYLVQIGFCVLSTMKAHAGEAASYPAFPFLSDPK